MSPIAEYKATAGRRLDRRVIRIDFPPAHAGITAALRHAFAAAAADPVRNDWDDLLKRLD
jgi:hypothetical protein